MDTEEIDLIDFLELINFTLSNEFVEKWRFKYSEVFLKNFQLKLHEALKKNKPLKLSTLTAYLEKKHKYSMSQILNFYESIDISLYLPLVV